MESEVNFRAAIESGDLKRVARSLHQDVVFHSPVLFHPFQGREVATQVLSAVADTVEDFAYTREFRSDGGAALVFKARIGSSELEGIDLLELDDQGLVRGLTVFMRPISALNAFSDAMGERLRAAGEEVAAR
jgi:SnoaL-like domain